MQAIILAAGMGKRLKNLTKNNTKCMIKVNGVTLIDRMLHQIEKYHLSRIVIVIGYKGQKLIDYISTLDIQTPIIYVNNNIYNKTNNIYSLALAKEYLKQEDTLLFESDIIFEDAVLDALVNDSRDTLALVDKYESWMDGTCVKLSNEDDIEEFVPGKKFKFNEMNEYYKTVNIYKFSKHFSESHYVPFLDAYQAALGENEYYEQVLRVITMLDDPEIKAKRLSGQVWYEIDDIQDLDIASSMFTQNDNQKVSLLQERYGGYWRYPRLIDFCYLVNPYFPPQKLVDEMKASFEKLLMQYPSGMNVNSLIASKNFGVDQKNILIGNGASELIKILMEHLDGKTGFVKPTFEEYINRYDVANSVYFSTENSNFSYTAQDLISFFENKHIKNLVIVNPDNPSGNYICKKDLLLLIKWTKMKNIQLIIDESFVDFADEENSTLIKQDILEQNEQLYVIKSISKSFGVPGIRIGVLASGNVEAINNFKKSVSIWNINSFGEFYMQIAEKYRKDYINGLKKYKKERKKFQNELSKISGIHVIPSQGNYIMIELKNCISSRELTKILLNRYNILVKDLSIKIKNKQFIRLAIRNTKDNKKLMEALKREICRYSKS